MIVKSGISNNGAGDSGISFSIEIKLLRSTLRSGPITEYRSPITYFKEPQLY